MSNLPESVIDKIVAAYLERGHPETDDPADDAGRLVGLAHALSGSKSPVPDFPPLDGTPSRDRLITPVAEWLHSVCPSLTIDDWWRIYAGILAKRYGGSFARIRTRPKLGKLVDADAMSLEDWQAKYGMSRAHYFRLRKEALLMRQRKAKIAREK